MKPALQLIALIAVFTVTTLSYAKEPDIKTPSPVIYLADNLDEKDNLGWCIDTLGRGFAERLQAHSCKPQGGDVQFSFNEKTGQLMSAEFDDFCMANRPNAETIFALETCDAASAEQQFVYDPSSGEFSPTGSRDKCVVIGSSSASAGPFMSRELLLADCSTTDEVLKKWVIRE